MQQRYPRFWLAYSGTIVAILVGGCGGMANPNTGQPSPEGTTRLTPITFSPSSGFPQGSDPAEFSVGDGSITAGGGRAGTLARLGLYADDSYSWEFFTGVDGAMAFTGLEVVAIDGYWVHPNSQSVGATMTVNFSGGGSATVASAPVNAGLLSAQGQVAGFFSTVSSPEGETITDLAFSFGDGAADGDVATLDVLELTVRSSG